MCVSVIIYWTMRKMKKEAGDSLVKKLPSGSALWNVWD